MTKILIDPERLKLLDGIELMSGGHGASAREYCFNEAAAFLAGEKHSDAPSCVSPVLRRFTMRLNDRWDDEQRQSLKPYLVRVIGTAGDGRDARREQIALEWTTRRLLGPWLRLAGLDDEADALESADVTDVTNQRRLIRAARDAAWSARSASRAKLRKVVEARVREELEKQGKMPAAVAEAAAADAAVAEAVAEAAAAAAAVAEAVAAAAAAAVAEAVAAAAAADAAEAVAAAAAADAAVAEAVAAAAAADAAEAVAAVGLVDWWGKPYSAAYTAARAYYEANPLPISQEIAALAAEQRGSALELLDLLIEAAPAEVSS